MNRTRAARDDAAVLHADPTAGFREGDTIAGKFVVVRWLGEGGMGSVYLATHAATGKRVALKHVRDASAPQARARFIREARAAARIHHPNVVDVYDVIDDASGLFLVMEHLVGETLLSRMQRAPKLSTEEAIAITLDIARALSAAHRERVVHRDLKPANVFLADEDGEQRIKVLDFGLAKILDETSSLSQSDHLVGTPHYMAPELVLGAVEARVEMDVYALGVILYELLSGTPPHDHERVTALLVDIATKPPAALHTRAPVSVALSDVVMKALAKNPADRYPSATAFAEALRACTVIEVQDQTTSNTSAAEPGLTRSVSNESHARRSPWPRIALLALLCGVVAVPVGRAWMRAANPTEAHTPVVVRTHEAAPTPAPAVLEVSAAPAPAASSENGVAPTAAPRTRTRTTPSALPTLEAPSEPTPPPSSPPAVAEPSEPASTDTPRAGTLSLEEF